MRLSTRQAWLASLDQPRIEAAIAAAEARTSAEIRVSAAPVFWGSVKRTAQWAFERMGMARTQERNGILIFVVPARRKFVVLGDVAVHSRVGQEFWDGLADTLSREFRKDRFTEGLIAAIGQIGVQLAAHFPPQPDAVNELADAVDLGESEPGPRAPA